MKAVLLPPDTVIHPDTKVWFLTELEEVQLGKVGTRRIQRCYLLRGDEMCVVERDMGEAKEFSGPEFRIPSLNEHTAAEVWDMADYHRDPDRYRDFAQRAKEIQGESTLITDWVNWLEERKRLVGNRSLFGSSCKRQRDDVRLAGVREELRKRKGS